MSSLALASYPKSYIISLDRASFDRTPDKDAEPTRESMK